MKIQSLTTNTRYKSTKSSQVGQIGLKSHVTYVTLSNSKNLLIKKKNRDNYGKERPCHKKGYKRQ